MMKRGLCSFALLLGLAASLPGQVARYGVVRAQGPRITHHGHRHHVRHHRVRHYTRVWTPGHYEVVRVPPRYVWRVNPWGFRIRVCVSPGYTKRVWVPGHWRRYRVASHR